MHWPVGSAAPIVAYGRSLYVVSSIRDAADTEQFQPAEIWSSMGHIWSVHVSPSGRAIATAQADGTVHLITDVLPPRDRKKTVRLTKKKKRIGTALRTRAPLP